MNKDEKINLKIFKEMWCSRNPCHEYDPLGNDRFWQTAELVSREYIERMSAIKPSCSTCGDRPYDKEVLKTIGNNELLYLVCPDCKGKPCPEQKQPSDDEIKGFHKLGLLISGFFITKKIDSSTYDQLLKYLYEAESDYKSQQSRIDELQEKLKVAEDALNGDKDLLTSIVESLPFPEGEKQIKRIDSALSTIKGETE